MKRAHPAPNWRADDDGRRHILQLSGGGGDSCWGARPADQEEGPDLASDDQLPFGALGGSFWGAGGSSGVAAAAGVGAVDQHQQQQQQQQGRRAGGQQPTQGDPQQREGDEAEEDDEELQQLFGGARDRWLAVCYQSGILGVALYDRITNQAGRPYLHAMWWAACSADHRMLELHAPLSRSPPRS